MTVTMSIQQAKANLSKLVSAAERGETAIITCRNEPVAEVIAVQPRLTRPMGLYPMDLSEHAYVESLAPVWTESELRELGLT